MADGIISHVSGPWSGRHHSTHIFIHSKLPRVLGDLPNMPVEDGGKPIAVYADSGYALNERIFMPYPDGRLDADHNTFNRSMADKGIRVKWGYERIQLLWQSLNFSTNQRILKCPVAAWHMCAVLFTNAVTCIDEGNDVSRFFGCRPPQLGTLFSTLSQ